MKKKRSKRDKRHVPSSEDEDFSPPRKAALITAPEGADFLRPKA
jgi:hypothetical protein